MTDPPAIWQISAGPADRSYADVVVTDGFRYRMFSCKEDFAPVAYANLARLKESATELFTRLQRP